MKNQKTIIHQFIIEASKAPEVEDVIGKVIPFVDLTSLSAQETEGDINVLCGRAKNSKGHVASVCIYPHFVKQVKLLLEGSPIKVSTVVNFPKGGFDLKETVKEIESALKENVDEIELVMPYQAYINGEWTEVKRFLKECRKTCGKDVVLKIILETGALSNNELIASASNDAINAGADFLKTSTGKIEKGASLEAAAVMLMAIKDVKSRFGLNVGFKASGGIKTPEAAMCYLNLAEAIMGKGWATPNVFRIGSSSIV